MKVLFPKLDFITWKIAKKEQNSNLIEQSNVVATIFNFYWGITRTWAVLAKNIVLLINIRVAGMGKCES